MTTGEWALVLNIVAILLAPIIALWVGGILQRRTNAYNAKLQVFGTLMAYRHDMFSAEALRALNLIDAVFASNAEVREAWTRYFASLNDAAMNVSPGYSIREEKKRELFLSMVKALGLSKKISSADLLRTYLPNFAMELTHVATLERLYRKATLEEDLTKRGIPFPKYPVPDQALREPMVAPRANGPVGESC
jgi:hypothetical protein